MNSEPLISIVLCTYNNAGSLKFTLDELSRCEIDNTDDVELLCVNNNSPDHTEAVVNELKGQFSYNIRYLFESRQGLSHARNLGLHEARGKYILFTDDDAVIPTNWINEYICHINKEDPDCLYSRIFILWDKPQPWWYIDDYRPYFVYLDYGDDQQLISDFNHEFFGKNFCVKKQLLVDFGGFDPRLGRNEKSLAAGEETLIYRNLVEENCKIIYFPTAKVGHRLKEREYSVMNIQKLFLDSANSDYYLAKQFAKKTFLGRPLYLVSTNLYLLVSSTLGVIIAAGMLNKVKILYHRLCIQKSLKILLSWVVGA